MIWVLRATILFVSFLWMVNSLLACPTCSAAMKEGNQAESLAAGFQYSILLMMALPFVILGSLGGFFYLQIQQAHAANADASRDES